MKRLFFFLMILTTAAPLAAQKYFTKSGNISFYSDAPLEKIEAKNGKATAILDKESGQLECAVLIKAFQFEKALMQEHFNENYMESDEYPKAMFKGEVSNVEDIDFGRNGKYKAELSGDLTIHGVTRPIDTEATLTVRGDRILGESTFVVLVEDYEIRIPGIVRDNIAKKIEIRIDFELEPFNR